MIDNITIESDGWSDEELSAIAEILKTENISYKKIAQFDFGISIVVVIVVSMFGGAVITGIGSAIGTDIWNSLKNKFKKHSENGKNSSIGFKLKNESYSVNLNFETDDPAIIERAFDTVDTALTSIKAEEKNSSFHFDNSEKQWVKIQKSEFQKTIEGIAATTEPVEQGGKKFRFSKDALIDAAKQLLGLPLNLGHGGKQIGEVISAKFEDNKLKYTAGIYDTTSTEDIETFEKIVKNGGGVSLGMSYADSL